MTGVLVRGGNLDTDTYKGNTVWRHNEKMAIYEPRRRN